MNNATMWVMQIWPCSSGSARQPALPRRPNEYALAQTRTGYIGLAGLLLCVFGGSHSAFASAVLSSSASYQPDLSTNSGIITGTSSTAAPVSASGPNGGAGAQSQYGNLQVSASSTSAATGASASASFSDDLTFSGGNGLFTVTIQDQVSFSSINGGGWDSRSGYYISGNSYQSETGSPYLFFLAHDFGAIQSGETIGTFTPNSADPQSGILTSTILLQNGTYTFSGYLSDLAQQNDGTISQTDQISFIIPQGVTLTAASGTEYQIQTSPVPIPAAAWLMLSGLGGLGVFVRISRLDSQRLVRGYRVALVALPVAYGCLVTAVNLTKATKAANSVDAAIRADPNKPTL